MNGSNGSSRNGHGNGHAGASVERESHKRQAADEGGRKKRVKRSSGKACVYCRRSHMVCEGGRPCERCVKREIAHLCRDVTPPTTRRPSETSKMTKSPSQVPEPEMLPHPTHNQNQPTNRLPTSLYSDPNFPPSWPLLPDTEGPVTFGDGGGPSDVRRPEWNTGDDTELGALTKFLGDLGVPSLPGGFLDVLSYFSRGDNENGDSTSVTGTGNISNVPIQNLQDPTSTLDSGSNTPLQDTTESRDSALMSKVESASGTGVKGKGKEVAFVTPQLSNISRIEKYFLAAADQPSGPRASRLAQVIKAKYDAGLLKPYDYIKGYERMNKWMDSGRAAPKADSIQGSAPSSPQRGAFGRARLVASAPATFGASISPESRRRILTALNGFRPKFRQIARTLTDVDLVFVEEAMERWMLEYDRAFASIRTPSCIWRRTGEIQKANQEFANLTGIPASMFRNGILCVYELMDEDSAVRYWEGYAKIAFDAGQRSLTTHCTLKIPMSLTRSRPTRPTATPGSIPTRASIVQTSIPDFTLPQALIQQHQQNQPHPSLHHDTSGMSTPDSGFMPQLEEYREIKCCFSVTIRRDAWGVPVAIMGQWIPI